jgi:hypothetical protein
MGAHHKGGGHQGRMSLAAYRPTRPELTMAALAWAAAMSRLCSGRRATLPS